MTRANLAILLKSWYYSHMTSTTEKAIEALEMLPEEMREPAVAYLLEQAEKYRTLKAAIDEGMADAMTGRVVPWNFDEFLKQAKSQR
jgi:predicted transcriptional regulator